MALNIYIDIDGVIAELIEAIIPHLNDHYGRSLTIDDIVQYDLAEVFEVARDEIDGFFTRIGEEGFYRELAVIEGAKEALLELAETHLIRLITFRSTQLQNDTEHWLVQNGIPFHDVVHIGNGNKADHVGDCDVFIEDSLDAAVRVADKGIDVLLFDYPWNRCMDNYCNRFSAKTLRRIRRVRTWSEVIEFIRKRETERKAGSI